MNNIRMCTNEFIKNLDDIILYIDSISKQKELLEQIFNETEKFNIEKTKEMYNEFNYVFRTPVAYNAIIISVYGCFETFIDKACSSYIEMLRQNVVDYEQLPVKLRDKHIRKTGEYLSNSQRFKNYNINDVNVVSNLFECMKNKEGFELNKELLLTHGGNLGILQLIELLSELGVSDCKGKILTNDHFVQRIAEKYEISNEIARQKINEKNRLVNNNLFEELEGLVEQRNRVAHGWVIEERISTDIIKNRIITFMKMLGQIVCDVLEESFVSFLHDCGKLKEFATPIDVYGNKVLCINSKDSHLKRGEYIYMSIDKKYKMLEVKEIQVDGESISEVNDEDIEIGIKVDTYIKKN